MAYSTEDDLLVGDLALSPILDTGKFVKEAAEEMDSKLGFIYTLPLPGDLPEYQKLLLKGINNKLASGRLIMAVAIGGEDSTVHAYAARLVQEATQELLAIANGIVELAADRAVAPADVQAGSRTPSIKNLDSESAVEAFTNNFVNGENWYWRPGTPA